MSQVSGVCPRPLVWGATPGTDLNLVDMIEDRDVAVDHGVDFRLRLYDAFVSGLAFGS